MYVMFIEIIKKTTTDNSNVMIMIIHVITNVFNVNENSLQYSV